MDTISSHESNTNYLPLAGVITGGVALLLAIFAFVQVKSIKNDINDIRSLSDRVAGIETQLSQVAGAVQVANNANQVASNTHNSLMTVARDTNASFKKVSDQLTELRERVERMGTRTTTRPPQQAAAGGTATAGNTAAPVEAGTDVYTVKSGDNGTKIFRATGFSQAQLEAVNPGINWSRLAIGQRIVLPKK
ncbi:LysM peptidoglycan-binding domain-containing protein [Ereboglobus luteus]|uniref:LysM domain-containing protein n=1 Tax=Ereboglobus luteus TaxID=1796921 RepID=A0A2U8E2A4_9BACT|nr:LysM domain-containing protein [Ereboglobus luteus]AWI09009.1 hypothetical protein CKA38_06900 [Ereboglobus luteus]